MRLIGNSDFKDKRKLKEIGIFWKITKELLSYTTKGFIIDLVTQSDKNFMMKKMYIIMILLVILKNVPSHA